MGIFDSIGNFIRKTVSSIRTKPAPEGDTKKIENVQDTSNTTNATTPTSTSASPNSGLLEESVTPFGKIKTFDDGRKEAIIDNYNLYLNNKPEGPVIETLSDKASKVDKINFKFSKWLTGLFGGSDDQKMLQEGVGFKEKELTDEDFKKRGFDVNDVATLKAGGFTFKEFYNGDIIAESPYGDRSFLKDRKSFTDSVSTAYKQLKDMDLGNYTKNTVAFRTKQESDTLLFELAGSKNIEHDKENKRVVVTFNNGVQKIYNEDHMIQGYPAYVWGDARKKAWSGLGEKVGFVLHAGIHKFSAPEIFGQTEKAYIKNDWDLKDQTQEQKREQEAKEMVQLAYAYHELKDENMKKKITDYFHDNYKDNNGKEGDIDEFIKLLFKDAENFKGDSDNEDKSIFFKYLGFNPLTDKTKNIATTVTPVDLSELIKTSRPVFSREMLQQNLPNLAKTSGKTEQEISLAWRRWTEDSNLNADLIRAVTILDTVDSNNYPTLIPIIKSEIQKRMYGAFEELMNGGTEISVIQKNLSPHYLGEVYKANWNNFNEYEKAVVAGGWKYLASKAVDKPYVALASTETLINSIIKQDRAENSKGANEIAWNTAGEVTAITHTLAEDAINSSAGGYLAMGDFKNQYLDSLFDETQKEAYAVHTIAARGMSTFERAFKEGFLYNPMNQEEILAAFFQKTPELAVMRILDPTRAVARIAKVGGAKIAPLANFGSKMQNFLGKSLKIVDNGVEISRLGYLANMTSAGLRFAINEYISNAVFQGLVADDYTEVDRVLDMGPFAGLGAFIKYVDFTASIGKVIGDPDMAKFLFLEEGLKANYNKNKKILSTFDKLSNDGKRAIGRAFYDSMQSSVKESGITVSQMKDYVNNVSKPKMKQIAEVSKSLARIEDNQLKELAYKSVWNKKTMSMVRQNPNGSYSRTRNFTQEEKNKIRTNIIKTSRYRKITSALNYAQEQFEKDKNIQRLFVDSDGNKLSHVIYKGKKLKADVARKEAILGIAKDVLDKLGVRYAPGKESGKFLFINFPTRNDIDFLPAPVRYFYSIVNNSANMKENQRKAYIRNMKGTSHLMEAFERFLKTTVGATATVEDLTLPELKYYMEVFNKDGQERWLKEQKEIYNKNINDKIANTDTIIANMTRAEAMDLNPDLKYMSTDMFNNIVNNPKLTIAEKAAVLYAFKHNPGRNGDLIVNLTENYTPVFNNMIEQKLALGGKSVVYFTLRSNADEMLQAEEDVTKQGILKRHYHSYMNAKKKDPLDVIRGDIVYNGINSYENDADEYVLNKDGRGIFFIHIKDGQMKVKPANEAYQGYYLSMELDSQIENKKLEFTAVDWNGVKFGEGPNYKYGDFNVVESNNENQISLNDLLSLTVDLRSGRIKYDELKNKFPTLSQKLTRGQLKELSSMDISIEDKMNTLLSMVTNNNVEYGHGVVDVASSPTAQTFKSNLEYDLFINSMPKEGRLYIGDGTIGYTYTRNQTNKGLDVLKDKQRIGTIHNRNGSLVFVRDIKGASPQYGKFKFFATNDEGAVRLFKTLGKQDSDVIFSFPKNLTYEYVHRSLTGKDLPKKNLERLLQMKDMTPETYAKKLYIEISNKQWLLPQSEGKTMSWANATRNALAVRMADKFKKTVGEYVDMSDDQIMTSVLHRIERNNKPYTDGELELMRIMFPGKDELSPIEQILLSANLLYGKVSNELSEVRKGLIKKRKDRLLAALTRNLEFFEKNGIDMDLEYYKYHQYFDMSEEEIMESIYQDPHSFMEAVNYSYLMNKAKLQPHYDKIESISNEIKTLVNRRREVKEKEILKSYTPELIEKRYQQTRKNNEIIIKNAEDRIRQLQLKISNLPKDAPVSEINKYSYWIAELETLINSTKVSDQFLSQKHQGQMLKEDVVKAAKNRLIGYHTTIKTEQIPTELLMHHAEGLKKTPGLVIVDWDPVTKTYGGRFMTSLEKKRFDDQILPILKRMNIDPNANGAYIKELNTILLNPGLMDNYTFGHELFHSVVANMVDQDRVLDVFRSVWSGPQSYQREIIESAYRKGYLKGVDEKDVLKYLESNPEMKKHITEEWLAERFGEYINHKFKPKGALAKFFEDLWETIRMFFTNEKALKLFDDIYEGRIKYKEPADISIPLPENVKYQYPEIIGGEKGYLIGRAIRGDSFDDLLNKYDGKLINSSLLIAHHFDPTYGGVFLVGKKDHALYEGTKWFSGDAYTGTQIVHLLLSLHQRLSEEGGSFLKNNWFLLSLLKDDTDVPKTVLNYATYGRRWLERNGRLDVIPKIENYINDIEDGMWDLFSVDILKKIEDAAKKDIVDSGYGLHTMLPILTQSLYSHDPNGRLFMEVNKNSENYIQGIRELVSGRVAGVMGTSFITKEIDKIDFSKVKKQFYRKKKGYMNLYDSDHPGFKSYRIQFYDFVWDIDRNGLRVNGEDILPSNKKYFDDDGSIKIDAMVDLFYSVKNPLPNFEGHPWVSDYRKYKNAPDYETFFRKFLMYKGLREEYKLNGIGSITSKPEYANILQEAEGIFNKVKKYTEEDYIKEFDRNIVDKETFKKIINKGYRKVGYYEGFTEKFNLNDFAEVWINDEELSRIIANQNRDLDWKEKIKDRKDYKETVEWMLTRTFNSLESKLKEYNPDIKMYRYGKGQELKNHRAVSRRARSLPEEGNKIQYQLIYQNSQQHIPGANVSYAEYVRAVKKKKELQKKYKVSGSKISITTVDPKKSPTIAKMLDKKIDIKEKELVEKTKLKDSVEANILKTPQGAFLKKVQDIIEKNNDVKKVLEQRRSIKKISSIDNALGVNNLAFRKHIHNIISGDASYENVKFSLKKGEPILPLVSYNQKFGTGEGEIPIEKLGINNKYKQELLKEKEFIDRHKDWKWNYIISDATSLYHKVYDTVEAPNGYVVYGRLTKNLKDIYGKPIFSRRDGFVHYFKDPRKIFYENFDPRWNLTDDEALKLLGDVGQDIDLITVGCKN